MRASYFGALLVLASLGLGACATQKPPKTDVVWQTLDGSVATREEIETAGATCAAETHATGGEASGRFSHLEWAVDMLDCMKRKGYQRVEKPIP